MDQFKPFDQYTIKEMADICRVKSEHGCVGCIFKLFCHLMYDNVKSTYDIYEEAKKYEDSIRRKFPGLEPRIPDISTEARCTCTDAENSIFKGE